MTRKRVTSAREAGRGRTLARVFSFPGYRRMARGFGGLPRVVHGTFSLERFPNGELHVELGCAVAGARCLVLGTIAPPEDNLASYLLLCHTLRCQGARGVVAVLPYLSYSRQDRREPGESHGAAWIGALLAAAGADAIVTLDAHSPSVPRVIPVPLVSLSPAPIFAEEIRRRSLLDATIVAPDEGAASRCRAVAKEAGMTRTVAILAKQRTRRGVVHAGLRGRIGRRAVIIDDMLDTGGTLLSCCEVLRRRGVEEIYIFVTHGLFTGAAWRDLLSRGVKLVACTDTVPIRPSVARSVTVCSISTLLTRGAWDVLQGLPARPQPAPKGAFSWNAM